MRKAKKVMRTADLTTTCLVEDSRWRTLESLEKLCQSCFQACFPYFTFTQDLSVGILFGNDKHLLQLNKQFRGLNKATNVLSFPACGSTFDGIDHALYLGDIALSYDTILQEIEHTDRTLLAHTAHMLIHGFLHLAGYDHTTNEQAEEMEKIESIILENLGFANPYLTT